MINTHKYVIPLVLVATVALTSVPAQKKAKKNKKKPVAANVELTAPGGIIEPVAVLNEPRTQDDFPVLCITPENRTFIAYIEHDGQQDLLKAARLEEDGSFKPLGVFSKPGNIYQPGLAASGEALWCVWSQMVGNQWDILARRIDGDGETLTISRSPGNDLFPDVKTDRKGRVWAAWQTFQSGFSDIFTAFYDPAEKKWSKPIRVTSHQAGDWEPRLAFSENDEALIVFDTYRKGNYDVWLARVSTAGEVKHSPVTSSPRYEARPEAACSPDGKILWVAYESGPEGWGKDLGSEWRQRGGGLHYDRHLYLSKVDLDSGKVTQLSNATGLIPGIVPQPGSVGSSAIDVPELVVDREGNPWLFFRYSFVTGRSNWQVACAKYDPAARKWTEARTLGKSNYCLDRRTAVALDRDGMMLAAWPSDLRSGKQQGDCRVYLAKIDPKADVPFVKKLENVLVKRKEEKVVPLNQTPERDRDDHHTMTFDGEEYTLYWGDVHRHTDFSNCRTTDDGCITEHFRYAYDASGLDFLATSDHTDAGKTYHAYEWWQTQKYADMFHNPGFFLGFYAYEREQRWPYGHRNVVFTERGGPVVYINRNAYEKSQWATDLPEVTGVRKGEIEPWVLWDILKKSGKRVFTIEHTSAGSMGTDWGVYKKIDYQIETLVEIYQGSRESYEGVNAPQPAVATRGGPRDFGDKKAGVYQNALKLGHRLGVFASSDHRSTNISFGGVYVKKFTREGVFEAMEKRRTLAATDKIYMEFACSGRLMGSIFDTNEKPIMRIKVKGTAPLRAVTLIRNETNFKVFKPSGGADFETAFTDDNPEAGENRYYIRVEQEDGNMGWTSPVWVTYKP